MKPEGHSAKSSNTESRAPKRPTTLKSNRAAMRIVVPALEQSLPVVEEWSGKAVSSDARGRIEQHFLRMEQGNLVDDRTPLFDKRPRPSIIGGFDSIVKNNSKLIQIYPGYPPAWKEVEDSNRKNIGPMSMFVPASQDCRDKIGAVMSDKKIPTSVNWHAYHQALDDIRCLLPPHSIKPWTVQEALEGIAARPDQSGLAGDTNSGFPWDLSKWNSVKAMSDGSYTAAQRLERREMLQDILADAKSFVKRAKQGASHEEITDGFVALTFQRTVQKGPDQLKSPKSKRYVLAMPKNEVVAGKTLQGPCQDRLKWARNPNGVFLFPAYWDKKVTDIHIQLFLKECKEKGYVPVSGDIDGYDQSLPPQLMWDVAQAMSTWFTKDAANLFLGIMYADIYKTMVLSPIGTFGPGPSSIKSGSIFTNLGGTIWNLFIQRYGHHAGYYRIAVQCAMGDDFIAAGPGLTAESIEAAFADLGMTANRSKQFVYPDMVHFLQMLHVYGIPGGQGSVYRILGGLLSVENESAVKRNELDAYSYVIQALQRLNNAIFNPLAVPLINYVRDNDKLRLGATLSPDEIVRRGGTYAERKLKEITKQPWRQGSGVEFRDWAINRVLRGDVLAPPGVKRYEQVYNIPFRLDPYYLVGKSPR